jgi:hypothetical protein
MISLMPLIKNCVTLYNNLHMHKICLKQLNLPVSLFLLICIWNMFLFLFQNSTVIDAHLFLIETQVQKHHYS